MKHPWFKPRGYAHFDLPLGEKTAHALVGSPPRVATHSFFPLLRYTVTTFKIKKGKSGLAERKPPKNRSISYAAHSDSHIYSYYGYLLSRLYEERLTAKKIGNSVLAFRALGKSNIDFANDAFEHIKSMGECSAFATDITGFFDNLNHAHLKKSWANVLEERHLPEDHYAVFKSLTRYSYVEKERLFDLLDLSEHNPPTANNRVCSIEDFRGKVRAAGLICKHTGDVGIPQGTPISALLSNIYLFDFDLRLHIEVTRRKGIYMRYCDDILCILPTQKATGMFEFVEALIGEYKLDINDDKTQTTEFYYDGKNLACRGEPLQYLGFTFDGKRKLIRSAAFARFSEKMKRGVNLAKKTAQKYNMKRASPELLWRRKLYERYSHLGKRNFVTYALKAAEIMGSKPMRKQIKPLWTRLARRIRKANSDL